MYDELIQRLRAGEYTLEELSIILPKAAEAIEELQQKIDEFYLLVQDVNRKEIAGHISENDLDAWLYAFQRYAAKIARKPPKGEAE